MLRAWFLLLVIGTAAGCEANPTLIRYGVYGYVREAESRDPLSGIRVTFASDTLRTGSDVTDDDGRYEIEILSDTDFGHLTLRDPRDRYETAVVDVFFDETTRRVDVDLARTPGEP